MKTTLLSLFAFFIITSSFAQTDLRKAFLSPSEAARPWVFWYWLNGAVSAEGITADLEAMKAAGIGGAYLMPIKDTANPSVYSPAARQLSPQWWLMMKHAMAECKRLDLKLALHVSDGFALAGGPWITPELSMQKLVWSQMTVEGGKTVNDTLPLPKVNEGWYRDVAVFAFPSLQGTGHSTKTTKPKITTSNGADASFLTDPANTKNFSSEDSCWIQYEFSTPFTLRSLVIHSRNNYQSNRLIIETSKDGKMFQRHTRLEPPRHGWQDWDSDYTHAVPEITARWFRFVYSKEGSEPGAEDLDAAKWKPVLKLTGIELSSEPRIHQYEGKNGEVWRVSKRTTDAQVSSKLYVPSKALIDVTKYLGANGKLTWEAPAGTWTILRIGHTSTGHRNETAGGGKGLECDKFNPEAVTLQFNNWFGEILKQGGAAADSVVTVLHVDSWECGSQNWSENFRDEFKKRRGYDPLAYLPAMAGIPVENEQTSEGFLYDVRKTIAELINDKFYVTLQSLAHKKGKMLSAESVAPTMVSDGMLHYQTADLPMGEFWLRSPTHDKPNDMLDAISGAHVYGKNVIGAEAFTELRMAFDEHPGNMKALADRNFAMGINKLVFHVFMQNPWMNRKPGVTLDPIGLLFQRDQIWWPHVSGWIDYVKRCQALLQMGKPVTGIAVFTGEELPRRSLLPERLVDALPGLFGEAALQREKARLANAGQPLRQLPAGVTHGANVTDAQSWNDPLRGYSYDSFNPDALLRLTTVRNGRIALSTGGSYSLLVVPAAHTLSPDKDMMSAEVAEKIKAVATAGATVLLENNGDKAYSFKDSSAILGHGIRQIFRENQFLSLYNNYSIQDVGKGRVISGVFNESSLHSLGLERDVMVTDDKGSEADSIVWTHRAGEGFDIYFLSNQGSGKRMVNVSLRCSGCIPELWDAVSGTINEAKSWRFEKGRTLLPLQLEGSGSIFIVLQKRTAAQEKNGGKNWVKAEAVKRIDSVWKVQFDTAFGGPVRPVLFSTLTDWSKSKDSAVRYYSGIARYESSFNWNKGATGKKSVWLNLGEVANTAKVFVNDVSCGILWTKPYRVDVTKAVKEGKNTLRIEVANTWANRMIGDSRLPADKRVSNTVYPFKMEGKPLLPAGLLGPVMIESDK